MLRRATITRTTSDIAEPYMMLRRSSTLSNAQEGNDYPYYQWHCRLLKNAQEILGDTVKH